VVVLWGLFLARRGDFLALVANPASKDLLRQVSGIIAQETALRIRPVILPTFCPGAWSSDHWSFCREGFPALMATDTAPLRYPYYHTSADTPDKVNFSWLSQIVSGFRAVIADVAETR